MTAPARVDGKSLRKRGPSHISAGNDLISRQERPPYSQTSLELQDQSATNGFATQHIRSKAHPSVVRCFGRNQLVGVKGAFFLDYPYSRPIISARRFPSFRPFIKEPQPCPPKKC